MARSIRTMAVLASLLTLLSSFTYNIAITRKIPTAGLGLLSLLNATIGFSILPTALITFAYPRLTARDNGLNIIAAVNVSSIFYLVTFVLTIAYLASVWTKMGPYAWLVLIIAVLSEITSYLQSITNSILMVKDRSRFVITSIIQSLTKFIAIPVIMVLGWTIEVILWSTFFIVFIPSLYAFIYSLRYNIHAYDTRRYLREVLSASWVPLMGYAINSFRSLDTMFIGIFGYAQLSIWYVIFILSKPFGYSGTLINVTYGELLERGKLNIIYRDFLILLLITTYVALALTFFPGIYINLVRPSMRGEVDLLVLPIILLAVNSVLGNVNQFISNVMQGVDKRDIENASEIRPGVYLRSLILHTHLAELVFTIVYLLTMAPLIIVFKDLGFTYYAVVGALVSSLLANMAALGFRFAKLGSLKSLLNGKALIMDYALPSLLSIIVLMLVVRVIKFVLYPSIIISLVQVLIASLITLAIYFSIAMVVSRNVRNIIIILIRRIVNTITASQP
ncbi:hypothetical protein [Vulcanisaeta distributa]|uniref:Polysaccharide biosynthesis protein n=1 Tax=Vulcanisaeta distributa (strain DSM 14429 / JCM 11212 / NBRC 100878 / IC-017) TaxID=572478 RepID=E1QRY7_VULDI|nr:hypothetical protein [Vulcanisaeta distributa]ADN50704.1 conserved hypothetical protein [Vulcanisaeta distributa DSM 14429]